MVPASVRLKLVAGFLIGALLLLAMAGLSLAVLQHMAARVAELNQAQQRVDRLRQVQYLVTAQSHYRAMNLLTHDDANLDLIAQAKTSFLQLLDIVEQTFPSDEKGALAHIREANQRFADSGSQVQTLYQSGDDVAAMQLHLSQEHPISHEIEGTTLNLLNLAVQQMQASQATLDSDQRLLTGLVIGFSIISLATALLLGYVLSWSFVLPLTRVHHALAEIASGRFDEHVNLPNRDEFGALGSNLNTTSDRLADLYGRLEGLNSRLRGTNTELLSQLQAQVEELARTRGLITQAEERLRQELAEVLHSRVQNRLLVLWYRLEDCQGLVDSDPRAARELLGEVRDQLDQVREQDVRELSHRLHPSIIRAGLLPALDSLAEEMQHLEIEIVADSDVVTLDQSPTASIAEPVRLTAYRVVEEALGNVLKHANASRVEVGLHLVDGQLAIEVTDDGRGFDQHAARAGLGLASIAARVDRVGGRWTIGSRAERGTRLTVRLPLAVEQSHNRFGAQVTLRQEGEAKPAGHNVVTLGV